MKDELNDSYNKAENDEIEYKEIWASTLKELKEKLEQEKSYNLLFQPCKASILQSIFKEKLQIEFFPDKFTDKEKFLKQVHHEQLFINYIYDFLKWHIQECNKGLKSYFEYQNQLKNEVPNPYPLPQKNAEELLF